MREGVNLAPQEKETDKKQTSSKFVGTLGGSTLLGRVRRGFSRYLAVLFSRRDLDLSPVGHKSPPSLGDCFGPALGIFGCVFPVLLDTILPFYFCFFRVYL